MEGLGAMTTLHLRKNLIENFDETFPVFDSLRYLNLRYIVKN